MVQGHCNGQIVDDWSLPAAHRLDGFINISFLDRA